jgi:hypothetical protein
MGVRMVARVRAVLFLLLVVGAMAVLSTMATTAVAGHTDIVGDWIISGGVTQVSGDSINVSGNVTVRDGGVLEISNCTLSIDSADDGGRGLLVAATGRLVAYDTVIQGSAARILVTFSNDTLLQRCTVRHIHGDTVQRSGIMCDGGRVSILNSTISDGDIGGVDAYTNLTLSNVTATGMPDYGLMMVTYFTDRSYTVNVADCHFFNEGDPSEDSRGIYAWSTIFSPGVDLVVKRTTVEGFGFGLTLYDEDYLDVVVEGCRFVGDKVGASITQWGGDMAFRGNLFGHCAGDAIRYDAWPAMALVFDGNTVENATRGWVFWAPMVGPGSEVTVPWGHLSVSNCTEAYVAQAYIGTTHFILTNSTLTNCTTAFVAHGDGTNIVTITVFDTPHMKGNGPFTIPDTFLRQAV